MFYITSHFPITSPTIAFFVVLMIILIAPIVMSKLRIPHIVGMVLAGVVIGKYGLNILPRDSSFELFGRVGLLYIIFLAGLEMDLEGFKKNIRSVGIFGLLTFLVRYALYADRWVTFSGSPHVYTREGTLDTGVVKDRSGNTILSTAHGKTYADNALTRSATAIIT